MKRANLTGSTFGRLFVECQENVIRKDGRRSWRCRCDCGKTVVVDTKSLTSGSTQSCGCYQIELLKARSIKHGESRTKLYYVWADMKSRCLDKNSIPYSEYGGRGITVCSEWCNSYEAFAKWAKSNGYTEGLTLDRIDVNGDYQPSNCRWVTMVIQGNNKRNNRLVEFNGETHTISERSRIVGIQKDVIRYRLNAGWSAKRALTTQVKRGGNY